ncbi:MAG TPA: hypothetical protein PKD96_03290 [Candidatus Absconditabacterales bacterium]|nr:hypothetical protein [Candidatus Absconditabacterales bacterium]HMT27302.1 hypothetical protein [Candidatus Absconditabacterales bacterium]
MIVSFLIFLVSLFLLVKGATLSTKYAVLLAESFALSKYIVGFIIVAVISILPETLVSINSVIEQTPSFGLSILFGSNVADLTLVFAVIIFFASKSIKIEPGILKNNRIFPLFLLLPIILGVDGFYNRIDGLALILMGVAFYLISLNSSSIDYTKPTEVDKKNRYKIFLFLLGGIVLLLFGAHFIVVSALEISEFLGVNSLFIGMLIVALGTVMPELLFSLKALKQGNDSLAVGDILGSVLADATVVVGILALCQPFAFPVKIIYTTGAFMFLASFLLFFFMSSERKLSQKEAFLLFLFWIAFIIIEFWLSH